MDKENRKMKTRIPLPLAPLPPLPNNLLKKKNDRAPLNTITGPNERNIPITQSTKMPCLAGPSQTKSKIIQNRLKSPFMIDTRFVTVRRGSEILDWNYDVFHDDVKNRRRSVPDVICISDEDEEVKRKANDLVDKENFASKKMRISTSTPALHTLEPARVKNIKRSLKRPHSRELQGLSPLPDPEGENKARRRLNFAENLKDRMQSPDYLKKAYMERLTRDYTTDMFYYLLTTEVKLHALPRVKTAARACIINWLMKVNGPDGNPSTIQTALWYLDSILCSGHVSLENMQLVSAAAYWIAAKGHGPAFPASKLIKSSNYAFSAKKLADAEKIILARLKYPRLPVIAQDFISYFAWWCGRPHYGEIEVAATFICLSGLLVNKSLCLEYPSVIAAASVRNALLLLSKKELMPRLQKCAAFVSAENKASNISNTCTILRHTACLVSGHNYGYPTLYEHYAIPPKYIAQTIVNAAKRFELVDTRSSHVVV